MAFTVMSLAPISNASDRVKPSTPCFEAEYAEMYGAPVLPAIEAILMTRPQPRSIIPGNASLVQRNVPVRLTSRWRCHMASSVFTNGEVSAMPALFTKMSGPPPNCSLACAKARFTLSVSETSHSIASVSTPNSQATSSATLSIWMRVRAASAIDAPSRANAIATARPMPRPPPVIRASRFSSRINVGAGLVPALSGCEKRGQGRAPAPTILSSRKSRRPLLDESAHAFAPILGFKTSHLGFDLVLQHLFQSVVFAGVNRMLGRRDRHRRPGTQTFG